MRLSSLDPLHTPCPAHAPWPTWRWPRTRRRRGGPNAPRPPGAHVMITMIAAATQALGGDPARATAWAAEVRAHDAALTRADFFRAFPMQAEATRARVGRAPARLGF